MAHLIQVLSAPITLQECHFVITWLRHCELSLTVLSPRSGIIANWLVQTTSRTCEGALAGRRCADLRLTSGPYLHYDLCYAMVPSFL